MKKLQYYIPGSMFILAAFLIVILPEILIALVAAALVMFGIGLLYAGHLMRKGGRGVQNDFVWFWADGQDKRFWRSTSRRNPWTIN